MPFLGNNVDAIFLPESVNTSTTLRINGGDLHLDDDKKLLFGSGDDLQIYHDGIYSYIKHTPSRALKIAINALDIESISGTKFVNCASGSVELYHNGTKAFETTSTGIDVTGHIETDTLNVSGISTFQDNVDLGDNKRLRFGDDQDLQIYHIPGGDSRILEIGSGNLYIDANQLAIRNAGGGEIKAQFITNGAVELYYDNVKRFETATDGIAVTGNIAIGDNDQIIIGDGPDLKLYHDGSHSYIEDSGVGNLKVLTNSFILKNALDNEFLLKATQNSSVELLYNNYKKFETTSTGVDVTGNLTLTGELRGPASFVIDPAAIGDNTGTVVIKGDLQVDGTTTTINSTTLTVDDKNIVLASGAADSAAADGAGITIDGADASLTWDSSVDSFKFGNKLGIGGPATSISNFRVAKPISGGTTYYNVLISGSIYPDVTSNAYYNFVQVKTLDNSGTPYTISNVQGYSASVGNNAISSDSTITALAGFRVANTWTAGTRNYGFRGQIPTGTNRWNVYMDGSAPNYFAGNVGIGTSNPIKTLQVQSASNTAIRIDNEDDSTAQLYFHNTGSTDMDISVSSANMTFNHGASERMRIDSSGRLGVGTTNPDQLFHISSDANTRAKIASTSTTHFGQLYMGDEDKFLIGYGSTHPNHPNELALRNNTGGIFFATGTSASQRRMAIDSSGNVLIGGTTTTETNAAYINQNGVYVSNRSAGTNDLWNGKLNGTLTSTINADGSAEFAGKIDANEVAVYKQTTTASANCLRVFSDVGSTSDLKFSVKADGSAEFAKTVQVGTSSNPLGSGNWGFQTFGTNNENGYAVYFASAHTTPSAPYALRCNVGGTGDTVTIRADGSAYFASSVGIATTAPTYYGGHFRTLEVSGSAGNDGGVFSTVTADGAVKAYFYTESTNDTATIGTVTNHPLLFRINAVEKMQIDTSGRLLVGKTASSGLNTGCEFRPDGMGLFTRTSNNPLQVRRLTTDGSMIELYRDGVLLSTIGSDNSDLTIGMAGVYKMRIDSSGNVGIGTTSASAKLHTKTTTADGYIITENSSNHQWVFGPVNATYAQIGGLYGAHTGIAADLTGNVGIGTTNPGAKLHVQGTSSEIWLRDSDSKTLALQTTSTIQYIKAIDVGTGALPLEFYASKYNFGTGNVGIGTDNPQYKLEVNGSFAATTKSFIIPHPTKPGYKLRHGSLEGPENGVYVRGRSHLEVINLPDYWVGLVDPDSITVSLTPIGPSGPPRVERIENNKVYVFSEDSRPLDYFYMVNAERVDVNPLEVEIPE